MRSGTDWEEAVVMLEFMEKKRKKSQEFVLKINI